MLRDILVLGTCYPKAQEACFREEHSNSGALQIIEMSGDNEKTMKTIQEQQQPTENIALVRQNRFRTSQRKCGNCGSTHGPRSCPAFNQSCSTCRKRGHFAKLCRSNPKQTGAPPEQRDSVNVVDGNESFGPADTWSEDEDAYTTFDIGRKPKGNS